MMSVENELDFDFLAAANSFSRKNQQIALERLSLLSSEQMPAAALTLLCSQNPELQNEVLDVCSEECVSVPAWREAFFKALGELSQSLPRHAIQSVLVLMQRVGSPIKSEWVSYYQKYLDDSDPDIRYQAYCLAELQEESSAAYQQRVKEWLGADDEDLRIVSIQAVNRLKPEWGLACLERRAESATGVEAFQILITRIHLMDENERNALIPVLCEYAENSRYSYAAILELGKYGNREAIEVLLKIAGQFLTEPTVRVAAAGAAAKLGSETGIALLEKFSKSRHGNPKYALELLDEIEQMKICDMQ